MPITPSANPAHYGQADATFQACGGEAGIRQLVDDFYAVMSRPDAPPHVKTIRHMHTEDLSLITDKLTRFLIGWTGGPKRFQEKYGPISIPGVHAHLPIDTNHRDAWLYCMAEALDKQADYPDSLKSYLMAQLAFPAERIREVCQVNL